MKVAAEKSLKQVEVVIGDMNDFSPPRPADQSSSAPGNQIISVKSASSAPPLNHNLRVFNNIFFLTIILKL